MRFSKIVFLFLLLASARVSAQQQLTNRIRAQFVNAPLSEFVKVVESQAPVRFYYDVAAFDSLRISLVADATPLSQLLDSLFTGPKFYYAVDFNKNIFLTTTEISTGFASARRKSTVRYDDFEEDEGVAAFRERKVYEIGTRGTANRNTKELVLSGYVRLEGSGDAIADATVKLQHSASGTATNQAGYYSLRLPPGRHVITFTSVGLKPTLRSIIIHNDGSLNVEMQQDVTRLQEVVVKSDAMSNTASLQMGANKLSIEAIKVLPASFGEVDVLKAILTLPGVKTVGEASSGFNVRGGSADQNLILLNGSTIYNPFHFFGFFSSFNPESIENVELFKASVPTMYGGRLSSVLRISGREGDKEKFKGSAGLGLVTSRLNFEGPILKNKLSFLVGARTTYSNWIFRLLPESSGYRDSKTSFNDANLTLDYQINDHNRLRLSAYASKDESNLNTDTTYKYNNRNISLEWSGNYHGKLYHSTMLGWDHFNYGNFSDVEKLSAYRLRFSINQVTLRSDLVYELSPRNTLKFGVSSILYTLNPGTYQPVGENSLVTPNIIPAEQGVESAIFVEENFDITSKLSVSAGIRYSMFNYLGAQTINEYAPGLPRSPENITGTKNYDRGEIINTYHGPEPRVSARYLITEKFSLKAGYTVMRQYIHMISNSVAISPTDIWKLSDPNIKPQYSEQWSAGVYKNFGEKFELSLEGYWKTIDNYLDYKSGAILVMNPSIEQDVVRTKGKGYGLEFLARKPKGNFNGWLAYTYSRIFLIGDDPISGEKINRGKYYPANYDKPHDFNFSGNQKFSKRVNFSLNINYSTGRPVTVPIGVFNYGGAPKTLYSQRNGYRIPDYFRMDISVNVEGNHKVKQLLHNSWTFGIYNLTGRKNPYSVYFTNSGGVIKGYKISIFGSAIPFINYNIRLK
jgi:outer membrane cobalamin receptor